MDNNSLAHTKWECKYHIVFAPKYRRQVIYKNIRADVGQILATLCKRKGIEIFQKRSILIQNSRLTNKKGELYFSIAKFPLYYRNIN